MGYADQALRCEQCGNQFIFTVEEQRRLAAAGKEVAAPALCPTCRDAAKRAPQGMDEFAAEVAQPVPPPSVPDVSAVSPPPPAAVVQPGRRTGRVKWFDARKGFGFVIQEDGSEIFVHHTGIAGEGYKRLEDGQPIEYEVEMTDKGPQAIRVVPIEAPDSGE